LGEIEQVRPAQTRPQVLDALVEELNQTLYSPLERFPNQEALVPVPSRERSSYFDTIRTRPPCLELSSCSTAKDTMRQYGVLVVDSRRSEMEDDLAGHSHRATNAL